MALKVKNITIEEYTIKRLLEEIEKEYFFKGQKHLPITKHRAISQVNNPRADENDVVLLVAFYEQQICGYIGMLPDYLFVDGKKNKIAWLTAWWVDIKVKGQGLGYKLMGKAFSHYNNQIAAISPSSDSLKVFKQSEEFSFISYGESVNYVFRYSKIVNSQKVSLLKKTVFSVLNLFSSIKLNSWLKENLSNKSVVFNEVNNFSSDLSNFIERQNTKSLFKWGKQEIEWLTTYPWIVSEKKKSNTQHYYFSAYAKSFFYKNIEVKKDNKTVAFFTLRFRDNFVTLPYVFFDNNNEELVLSIILYYIKKHNALTLTITNKILSEKLDNLHVPYLKKDTFFNELMISNKFDFINYSDFFIQDGSGDNAFT